MAPSGGSARGPSLFAPYVFGHGDMPGELKLQDLADPAYDYLRRDWYQQAASSERAGWSEPRACSPSSGTGRWSTTARP